MMRYWNSREILDEVFERLPIESSELADTTIDFVVDLVRLHNFQTETRDSKPNAEVGALIAGFLIAWSKPIVDAAFQIGGGNA